MTDSPKTPASAILLRLVLLLLVAALTVSLILLLENISQRKQEARQTFVQLAQLIEIHSVLLIYHQPLLMTLANLRSGYSVQ